MTNADVIRMVKAGLSEDLVMASIEAAASKRFDISPDGLIALKQAGVADAIMNVMMGRPRTTAPPKAAAAEAPAVMPAPSPPTPTTSSDGPGIYVEKGGQRVMLEPTVITGVKDRGGARRFFLGRFAAAHKVAEVRGSRSSLRVEEPVTFYFVFPQSASQDTFSASVGNPWVGNLASASSPNEFVLIQMYVDQGKNVREMDIGKEQGFSSSSGVDSENVVPLKVERLAAGRYRVTPGEKLGEGEFCFFYAAGAANMGTGGTFLPTMLPKLFDFGVD